MGRVELQGEMLPEERFRWSPRGLLVFDRLLQHGYTERSTANVADRLVRRRQCPSSVHA